MTFTHALATNNYGPAKFVVSSSVANGTHTTISSALSSASSGDTIFIRPGTYTENVTLKAGVNLTAFPCDYDPTGVVIAGTVTASYNGTAQISGIRLTTNSAAALAVSGSSSSALNLIHCEITGNNNDAITINAANFSLVFIECLFAASSTFRIFAITTVAGFSVYQGIFSSADNTANTIAAGSVNFHGVDIASIITTSTTGSVNAFNCTWTDNNTNSTILTTAGTGASTIFNSMMSSGSASTISIGSGTTVDVVNCSITSSNTNVITGTGTLNVGDLVFTGTSSTINTTTVQGYVEQHGSINLKTPLSVPNGGTGVGTLTGLALGSGTSNFTAIPFTDATSWTPTVVGSSGAGTATYTIQVGRYTRIGSIVYVTWNLAWNTGTGTGNLLVGGLPINIGSTVNVRPTGSVSLGSALAPPATTVTVFAIAAGDANATQLFIQSSNATGNTANVAYAASGAMTGSLIYFTS